MSKGWDGPLEVDIRFMLPELASAMQAGYDESGMGRKTGRLRRALGTLANFKTSAGGKRVTIRVAVPYAAIHDQGGRIPDRRPVNAKAMRWIGKGGEVIFRKFAKGYDVPARNFTGKGVGKFIEKYSAGSNAGIQITWKDKRG